MSPVLGAGSLGYDDYQRTANFDSGQLASVHSPPSASTLTFGPFNMSRWAYLAASISPNTNPFLIQLQWSADEAGFEPTGAMEFTITPSIGEAMQFRLPNLGAWVTVTFMALGGLNWGSDGFLYATNRVSPLVFTPEIALLIDLQSITIPTGFTQEFYPSGYYAGPVSLWFESNGNNNGYLFQYLSPGGAWNDFNVHTPPTAGDTFASLVVPMGAWRVHIANSSGVTITYFLAVTPSLTGSS